MKLHEIALVAVCGFLVFKRVEGYGAIRAGKDGSLDSYYIGGGRPAEFFNTFSPSEWSPKSPGYIFDPVVEMDNNLLC
jgi:hypothetical protein